MIDATGKARLLAVLALTAVLVVIGVLNLRDQLSSASIPDEGIGWIHTETGIEAKIVRPYSPLFWSIRRGDHLRAFRRDDRFEIAERVEDVERYLEAKGIGRDALYVIEHRDPVFQAITQAAEP